MMSKNAGVKENCWKRIGVWGEEDRLSCPELERVIHCRNCELFTRAGRTLLERELPENYKYEWTEVLASKKEEEMLGTISVLIFRLEREWLALSTQLFEEIIDVEQVESLLHSIPHRMNPVLMGVINIHGEIRMCISLKGLLKLESANEQEDRTMQYKRMMVVQGDGEQWVFPVDEIQGIYRIHPKTLQNVPVTVAKARTTYTKGIFEWRQHQVALLDEELLLHNLARSVK
ncbi:MAG: chemotaxis protein CheW [bacterium]|nr:chemotaxis protein CheW [bacterium]